MRVISDRRLAARPPLQEETGNVFEFLRHLGGRYRSVEIPGLPPFTAGAVGYLSYEAVRMLERLPPRVDADVDLDDAVFMYFSNVLAFDHVQHRLFLISNVLTEEGKGSLRTKYDAACRHLDHLESRLRRPLKLSRTRKPKVPLRVRTNMTRPHYEAMVERSKEYIRAGDIFQVVLSQRMEVPVRVPAFDVYRALRAVNPSPYMYYLRLGESTVLGSSPEMLVKVSGAMWNTGRLRVRVHAVRQKKKISAWKNAAAPAPPPHESRFLTTEARRHGVLLDPPFLRASVPPW